MSAQVKVTQDTSEKPVNLRSIEIKVNNGNWNALPSMTVEDLVYFCLLVNSAVREALEK